jgi:hypothetical protein
VTATIEGLNPTDYGEVAVLTVEAGPVAGEKFQDNNSIKANVIFKLKRQTVRLVQGFEVLAVLALVVAIATSIGLFLVFRRLQRYQRNQHVIMGSRGTVDIVEHVSALDDKLANMRVALEDLTLIARDHDVRIDSGLSRVGVVRFNAYQDLGGRQSTAVAFLNTLGNGVVITTVVSRDFARIYVKLLKDGVPDIALAPEEIEAIEQARGVGPFTIRPRVEVSEDSHATPAGKNAGSAAAVSGGLPGRRAPTERELARENRRRKRQGLPPVVETVTPSATGWKEPVTPSPQGDTMDAEYVRLHKSDGTSLPIAGPTERDGNGGGDTDGM